MTNHVNTFEWFVPNFVFYLNNWQISRLAHPYFLRFSRLKTLQVTKNYTMNQNSSHIKELQNMNYFEVLRVSTYILNLKKIKLHLLFAAYPKPAGLWEFNVN